ncbi:hypothetical protein GCM10018987_59170 [Streptomyces cremeus]
MTIGARDPGDSGRRNSRTVPPVAVSGGPGEPGSAWRTTASRAESPGVVQASDIVTPCADTADQRSIDRTLVRTTGNPRPATAR